MLFGLNTGIGSVVSAGLLFVIALAELPWRSAFLLYGFFAVVFVFSFLFIPFDPKRSEEEGQNLCQFHGNTNGKHCRKQR